tara:strand:- start:18208 stop:18738 length:531 start_codon:yes stop_codon:yes gene_type:complete
MVIAKACEVMMSPMFWDDDDTDDIDGTWNAWAITFYGHIPRHDKESEGNLTLKNDGLLKSIEWRFPRIMAEGWKSIIYANEKPLLELDLDEQSRGRAELDEPLILMCGSSISARIFYIHGDADFVPASVANHNYGQGYSLTLSGVQQGEDILFNGDYDQVQESKEQEFGRWQMDMV